MSPPIMKVAMNFPGREAISGCALTLPWTSLSMQFHNAQTKSRDTFKISILDDGRLFGVGFPLCGDGNLAFNFTEKNVTITVRFFYFATTLTYSYESGKQGDFSGHLQWANKEIRLRSNCLCWTPTIREHWINSDLVSSFGFQRMPLVCFKAVDYLYWKIETLTQKFI